MSFLLGYHLVKKGILPLKAVDRAFRRQLILGGTLDTNILELELLQLDELSQAIAESFHSPILDEKYLLQRPAAHLLSLLPLPLSDKFNLLPLAEEGGSLLVATVDSGFPPSQQTLEFLFSRPVKLIFLPELRFFQLKSSFYSSPLPPRFVPLDRRYPLSKEGGPSSTSSQMPSELASRAQSNYLQRATSDSSERGEPAKEFSESSLPKKQQPFLSFPSPEKLRNAFRPSPSEKLKQDLESERDLKGGGQNSSERGEELRGAFKGSVPEGSRRQKIVEISQVFSPQSSDTPTLTDLDPPPEGGDLSGGADISSERSALIEHYAEAFFHSNDPEQLKKLREELLKFGSSAIPSLLKFLPGSHQADLKNEVLRQRIQKIVDFCRELEETALLRLLKVIETGSKSDKIRALIVIGEWRPPRAIAPLLNLLYVEKDTSIQRMICNDIRRYRGKREFDKLLEFLRDNLRSDNIQRLQKALFFISNLRIVDAIEDVIQLLKHPSEEIRNLSLQTLRTLTLQNFGPEFQNWQNWYQREGKNQRKKWVVDAMDHPSLEIRKKAKVELQIEFGDDFGFDPESPPEVRKNIQKLASLWIKPEHQKAK